MNASVPLIELQDISKSFKVGPVYLEILKGISLSIYQGEMVSIMGSSGSGKSTMMNIIGLLDTPSTGYYSFEGSATQSLGESELAHIRNKQIGFVFQQFNLLARLSALDNVALPLLYRGMSQREAAQKAKPYLDAVGMGDRADHIPSELSGGQQQRVAIARALVGNPSIILADEPTGALDSAVGKEIMDLFTKLNQEQGITVVIITHDQKVAEKCKRQVVMVDGKLKPAEAV